MATWSKTDRMMVARYNCAASVRPREECNVLHSLKRQDVTLATLKGSTEAHMRPCDSKEPVLAGWLTTALLIPKHGAEIRRRAQL